MANLCVFCGSRAGNDPSYAEAARRLGAGIAARGWGLVYGGGHVGLMGVLADAARQAGGHVIGVIPRALVEKELAHAGLEDLRVVASMHERKALMASLADAFLALPGGYGTLEELFEIVTWAQLNFHAKPILLLNTAGYFDSLLNWVDHAIAAGLIRSKHRNLLRVEDDPEAALEKIGEALPPPAPTAS
jgi:uncharacterized protein (TIGR00730 family)